jgi:hypothetical protein
VHTPGTDFNRDHWELYHVDNDFTESVDLAARDPAKLEELKKLWWSEAPAYRDTVKLECSAARASVPTQTSNAPASSSHSRTLELQ